MTSINRPSSRRQRGFTLVEILVTVVLISVGLLGVAALQLTTLRGNQEAYVRSQASVLAGDILDRMRANPIAFRNNLYNAALNGTGAASTPAGNDLLAWQQSIDQLLPGGATNAAGSIDHTIDPANPNRHIVTITIQWQERPEGTGTTNTDAELRRTFVTRSEI